MLSICMLAARSISLMPPVLRFRISSIDLRNVNIIKVLMLTFTTNFCFPESILVDYRSERHGPHLSMHIKLDCSQMFSIV